jgi:hypothetical protein
MKASNKILLAVFLLAVLILAGIHVALYAKIKAADFASNDELFFRKFHQQQLPPTIKAVSITGLWLCNLGNGTPSVSYLREGVARLKINTRNDTVYIYANDWATKEDYERGIRNPYEVSLRIPENIPVRCEYGRLFLSGDPIPNQPPSFDLHLRCQSELIAMDWEPKQTVYFNKLQIVADSSSIELSSMNVINEMNIQATNARLNYKHAEIKQQNLQIDDKTTIAATRKSLGNINFLPNQ